MAEQLTMDKINVDNILKNVDELNTQNITTTSSSEDDSISTKLCKIGDEISEIQKNIDNSYKNVLIAKKHISFCLLTSFIGRYYYYKALKTYKSLNNMLTLLKSYNDSNGISDMLSQLRELITLYFAATGDTERTTIQTSIYNILNLIGSYNINDTSAVYDIYNDNIIVKYSYPKTIKYIPDANHNSFKILYGNITDSSLIAQTTPISIIVNKSYDSDKIQKINVTAVNYNIINKEFARTSYNPAWFWRGIRYESIPYEIDNEDATNTSDTSISVMSALYFNGSQFSTDSTINSYSGLSENESDTIKFLKQSNKWNFLNGKVTVSHEYDINKITTELIYDDTDPTIILARNDNKIADSVNLTIDLTQFTLSGELEYSAIDSTSDNPNDDNYTMNIEYFDDVLTDGSLKKVSISKPATCFTGSLVRSTNSNSNDINESVNSTINVKCYIMKIDDERYRIEIKPNLDDTTVTSLYSSNDIDDISLIAAASQIYIANADTKMTTPQATDLVNGALNQLSKLDLSLLQSELVSRIYMLESSITSGINQIKTKATEQITEISNYLYSYTVFSDCCKSEITIFDDTYVSNISDAFTTAYGNISAISSFNIDDSTTYDSTMSTISTQLDSLLDSINTNLDGGITSYSIIEEIRNSVGAVASQYVDTISYTDLLTTASEIMSGNSDTISALASGGFVFKPCRTTYNFKDFNTIVNSYLNGSNYYTSILYLLRENYHIIVKIDNSDIRLTTINNQYYKIIKQLVISNMFNQSIINYTKYKELINLYSEMNDYKLQICDNINNYFINSNILIYSDKLEKFNYIDISELFDNTNMINNDGVYDITKQIAPYKSIIYDALTDIDISDYATFFGSIMENEFKFGKANNLNLRDLFFIETFRSVEYEVVSTLKNYDYPNNYVPSAVQDLSTLQIYGLDNNVFNDFKQKFIDYKKYYSVNNILSYFTNSDFIKNIKLKDGD